ncbi:uncharacterized protein LOC106871332 isoform X2 [Octopus bimaculoides]|nr:uncharacterized protein LOC106871332 isoform X2 [Octopus bimaculoides]XP_052827301.1 uncharacterized protein LOC106871332 isoform X2 [Octopus bimaculoides]XP_052827302.1 uncharacterized protein LOC106871332 isoform X2 [Octopus bimaculoides]|eukprot:XP_014773218.1 PREDICTED: uncharacterized protein LOC106871332 isoform X2 [Octopus bimaculoides]
MTSKPKRKVMQAGKQKLIGSTTDSSGTTEQTYRSASPRLINRIETQKPTSKAEPLRYVGHPIKTSVPFNRMLSTSTPDPEKFLTTVNWTDCDTINDGLASNTQSKQLLPERQKSKKLMQTKKAHAMPVTSKQCKTDQILRKQKSPTNITNNAVQQKKKTHSEVENPKTSLGIGVSSSSPSYGNAYSFSVHQVNKMSPKLDTVNNQSAFDPVVPSSKHEWKTTANASSNATKLSYSLSQCITSSNAQKPVLESIPVVVPLISTESDAPNLDSRQVPSCTKEQSTYYPPDLLNYKLPDYPAKSTNTAETQHQIPIQEPLQLIPERPIFLDKTVQTSQPKEQFFTGIDTINTKLQPSAPVSISNHQIISPVSNHFFTPINPSQGSMANVGVTFEEPVRDNNVPGYSSQLNQPKTVPSNNLISGNSNPAGKSLKGSQGNVRNGFNDNASPPEYTLGKTTKNHQTMPGINCKENPNTYGCSSNGYDIHLQWQSVEALAGAKTLKFIINELKETCKSTNHREIIRMVNQLEDLVNTLPQLQDTFDLQTEFCLALQPLRTENNRLHKSLRMLAEEKAQVEKKMEEDHRREILELQLQLLTLEKHVDEEKLQNQLQLHHHEHVIKDLKNEQEYLVKDLGKRDNSQLNMRLKNWEENQVLSKTIQEVKDQLAQNVHNLDVSEKKNHILQLTVEQRDREISNLHGVLHSVRKAMQGVLENIDPLSGNTSGTDTLGRFFKLFCHETDPECSSSMLSACSNSRMMLAESQKVSSNVDTGKENSSNVTPKRSASEQSVDQRLQALWKTMTGTSNSVMNPAGSANALANSPKHNQPGDISVNGFELPHCPVFESREQIDQQNRLYNYQMETKDSLALKDNDQQSKPDRDNVSCLSSKLEHSFDSQNKMEISNDSRASITDYFQKYPRAKALNGLVGADSKSISNYEAERAQPLSVVLKNIVTSSPVKEICCDSDEKHKTNNTNDYHNIDDEETVSNLSQYTINTDSSLNADILNFRNGLASLDADIAQLEQSIKESK